LNIITIDLEEWFHINNSSWIPVEEWPSLENRVVKNTDLILSILKKHNIKASFFVLGWIAEQYPELIRDIIKDGHDIGYHSYYHRIPRLQSKDEFENDLIKGIELLENILNKKIEFYRAPNFSLKNKWMLDCLIANGIKVSSSIKNPMQHNGIDLPKEPFFLKRGERQILEMPLNSFYMILIKYAYSGGGYLRLLPYPLLKTIINSKAFNMVYLHPNDFDKNVPLNTSLGIIRNILNRIGTTTLPAKFEKLLNDFEFCSISEAMGKINISRTQIINY
jgi:peptidoglycan-N-acetylglucosamine deacetylase